LEVEGAKWSKQISPHCSYQHVTVPNYFHDAIIKNIDFLLANFIPPSAAVCLLIISNQVCEKHYDITTLIRTLDIVQCSRFYRIQLFGNCFALLFLITVHNQEFYSVQSLGRNTLNRGLVFKTSSVDCPSTPGSLNFSVAQGRTQN